MICGSGRAKSRLAKAVGEEPSGQMRDETLHAVLARSTFRSQNVQNTRFGALLEVETLKKCMPAVHAAVARSTCRSQNVQSTSEFDPFRKLRHRKSARCCGAKHMSKSK